MGVSAIASDDLWPRDDAHRFRVYANKGGALHVLAAAPTPQGAGLALATLHADAKQEGGAGLPDAGNIGLLDVRPGEPTGEWIVNPFNRKDATL